MGYFIIKISFNLLFFLNRWTCGKLQAKWLIVSYAPFALNFGAQRCRTRRISKITCVLRTETVTGCCYVNRQISVSLLSTNIKLLVTKVNWISVMTVRVRWAIKAPLNWTAQLSRCVRRDNNQLLGKSNSIYWVTFNNMQNINKRVNYNKRLLHTEYKRR